MRKTLICLRMMLGLSTLLTAGPQVILTDGYTQVFEDENGDPIPENTLFEGDISAWNS